MKKSIQREVLVVMILRVFKYSTVILIGYILIANLTLFKKQYNCDRASLNELTFYTYWQLRKMDQETSDITKEAIEIWGSRKVKTCIDMYNFEKYVYPKLLVD